jgi:hypothetical protein
MTGSARCLVERQQHRRRSALDAKAISNVTLDVTLPGQSGSTPSSAVKVVVPRRRHGR